jgi:hypothetical protein
VRRLTGDAHLSPAFATAWPAYDLDPKTRGLLGYAKKLTEAPMLVDDGDVAALRDAGWDARGIYEATALIALFNFSGRSEAASGLPPDRLPAGARPLRALLQVSAPAHPVGRGQSLGAGGPVRDGAWWDTGGRIAVHDRGASGRMFLTALA